MKSLPRVLVLASLVVLALMAYLAHLKSDQFTEVTPSDVEINSPPLNPSVPPKSSSISKNRVAVAPNKEHSGLNSQVHSPDHSNENGLVEFKVLNGLAIAQGDILLGSTDEPLPGGSGHSEATAVRFWESPEIPYAINPEIQETQRLKIEKAIAYLRAKTPVHLIPYEGQRDAIIFEAGTEHCLSILGKAGGLQPIRLDRECGTQEVLHEIMHSLGFAHEQSRRDRDQFVEILWKNIEEKYQDQFSLLPEIWMEPLRGSRFDSHSIMMYRTDTFSVGAGMPTMRSRSAEQIQPVAEGLSPEDIQRLNRLFHVN